MNCILRRVSSPEFNSVVVDQQFDENAPCYKAKEIQKFLDFEDVNRLLWPACSPDMNPFNTLWAKLSPRLINRATNLDELRQCLRLVGLILEEAAQRDALYSAMRQYQESRDIHQLIQELKMVLNEPSLLELYEDIRYTIKNSPSRFLASRASSAFPILYIDSSDQRTVSKFPYQRLIFMHRGSSETLRFMNAICLTLLRGATHDHCEVKGFVQVCRGNQFGYCDFDLMRRLGNIHCSNSYEPCT
ncbi:hypothetical protein CAPTEDRAFT_200041 [Capitella teleta]|uniref:Harmonin N-terminal domain-containing protein n=1 Tax=Capitella teleta TaxID=283909 RepID=R7UI18_CAPTE|nr:hypothetical protein CAPTEDRAFT_200041 [Capitella teleta]|eukprot:ELU05743.1 hypothetical protein CAPTEDRAFT_200041 [Capitella teleta]